MLIHGNQLGGIKCDKEKCQHLELYRIMAEEQEIGLMIGEKGEYRSLNPVMDLFIAQCSKKLFLPCDQKNWVVEFQPDTGQSRHFSLSLVDLMDGKKLVIVIEITDNVLQKERTQKLVEEARRNANHDYLTGLANRSYLFEAATQILLEATRDLSRIAVFALDIDKFKSINDTFGHNLGDDVLRRFAKSLKQLCRNSDFIARLGGDEFCIIQRNVKVLDDVTSLAEKLVQGLQDTMPAPQGEIELSSSIGIALFPGDGANIETLLQHADQALYDAKEAGRNCFRIYSKKLNQQALKKAAMITNLYSAFDKKEFYLRYQPTYNIDNGCIKGVEAFVRWRPGTPWSKRLLTEKDNTDIRCDVFLHLMERMGRSSTLFEWTVRTACENLAQWRKLPGHKDLTISLNCSMHQFKSTHISRVIEENLHTHNLPYNAIFLEIHEDIFNSEEPYIQKTLKDLRSLGTTLVLDGFTWSKVSPLLRQWQPDCVKLNMKNFLKEHSDAVNNQETIADLISIAKHLSGAPIHAGYIESKEQLSVLIENGCKIVQGHLFSRSMNAKTVTDFLRQNRSVAIPSQKTISV